MVVIVVPAEIMQPGRIGQGQQSQQGNDQNSSLHLPLFRPKGVSPGVNALEILIPQWFADESLLLQHAAVENMRIHPPGETILRVQKGEIMHPVLINLQLGNWSFPVFTYGLMLLISFMLSITLAIYLGKQRRYPRDYLTDLCMWAILVGIVGCRLGYVVQYPAHYLAHPVQILNLREGGLTITGGVVLSVLSLFLYFRWKKVPVLNVLDFLAAPLLVGMAWGRMGCLMQGCCFGEICDLPWAITYPATTNLGLGLVSGPRHPSQIYEALMDGILLAYLIWLLPRQKFAGQSLYTVFAGYGVIRYLDELTRWVDPATVHGPLNLYQWISVSFFLFGTLGLLGAYGKPPVVIDLIPPDVADKQSPPEDYRRCSKTTGPT